jgi:hypothetical protein
MTPFLYRCPVRGLRVQGWFADSPSDTGREVFAEPVSAEVFEGVTCLACGQLHLVNPRTGKLAGESADGPPRSAKRVPSSVL